MHKIYCRFNFGIHAAAREMPFGKIAPGILQCQSIDRLFPRRIKVIGKTRSTPVEINNRSARKVCASALLARSLSMTAATPPQAAVFVTHDRHTAAAANDHDVARQDQRIDRVDLVDHQRFRRGNDASPSPRPASSIIVQPSASASRASASDKNPPTGLSGYQRRDRSDRLAPA